MHTTLAFADRKHATPTPATSAGIPERHPPEPVPSAFTPRGLLTAAPRARVSATAFTDDELLDDRLMEGQRLQLHVSGAGTPRPPSISVGPASSSHSPPPLRATRGGRRPKVGSRAAAYAAREVTETARETRVNNLRGGGPIAGTSPGRFTTHQRDGGEGDGRASGAGGKRRGIEGVAGIERRNGGSRSSRHSRRRSRTKAEVLAGTNCRRRGSPRHGSGGGGPGRPGASDLDAAACSDREAKARAMIEELDRAFRRNAVLSRPTGS